MYLGKNSVYMYIYFCSGTSEQDHSVKRRTMKGENAVARKEKISYRKSLICLKDSRALERPTWGIVARGCKLPLELIFEMGWLFNVPPSAGEGSRAGN